MTDLRAFRLGAGLTQTELARRTGIAQPNIAAYESGRRTPSTATLARLEAALAPSASSRLEDQRDQVVEILERYGMTDPRVFGSVAAGTDGPESDIDLLVDAGPDLDLLDLIDAATLLEALLGAKVDIITSRSLREGHEIARTAVPL